MMSRWRHDDATPWQPAMAARINRNVLRSRSKQTDEYKSLHCFWCTGQRRHVNH